MDFLNDAYQKLINTFKPMSGSAKITTGLLLAAVIVGVVFLFQQNQLGGETYLLGGHVFTQDELSKASAAFGEALLNDFVVENQRIRVPHSKRYLYLGAMQSASAMPETNKDLWTQLLGGSVLESSEVRKWRNAYRKKRELERTLQAINGVKSATVDFNVEPASTLMGEPKKSALVAVSPSRPRQLDLQTIKSIRTAASFALNMAAQDVAVLDTFENKTYRADPSGKLDSGEDEYSAYKRIREGELARKLNHQLSYIPGAIVDVEILLSPEMRHRVESVRINDKPTALQSSAQTEEEVTIGGRQGRPGVATNNDPTGAANSAARISANTTETTRNTSREEQVSVVGQERTTRELLPFSPKYTTVSITIPETYIEQVWKKSNPNVDGEDPKVMDETQATAIKDGVKNTVTELVNNLLPKVEGGQDPFPRVVVGFVEALDAPPVEGPSAMLLVAEWFQDNWKTLGMGLLGLFGVIALRGMIKTTAATASSEMNDGSGRLDLAAATGVGADGALAAEDASDLAESLKERFNKSDGPNLREELSEVVEGNLDSAAEVLNAWIGDR